MATMQEMITYKQEQDELRRKVLNDRTANANWRAHNPMCGMLTPIEMSASVRVMRAKAQAEASKAEARERKQRVFIGALNKTYNERNATITHIVSLTIVRKDGKNVAKSNCKDMRADAQTELARINKRINRYEAELAGLSDSPKREAREPSRWARIRQRDLLVREMLLARKGDNVDATLQEIVWLNETFCRPTHGYPRPPYRRTDDYPAGGALGRVKGQNELGRVSGEMERLAQYGANLQAKGEGHSERIERMCLHLAHLSNERTMMGDEHTVRRAGKHFYRLMCDSRA